MRANAQDIKLSKPNDLFTRRSSDEIILDVPLEQLVPFHNHPFKVLDDDAMQEMAESIKEYGVMVPVIARPNSEGTYELIAGHRRHFASKLAGLETIPVIVKEVDDDAATIIMVDSNLQRETILPSERAFAYKMKLEAMKRQAGRPLKNSSQVGRNFEGKESREILAEQVGQSKNQISRYVHLTALIPQLLDMVDQKKIALNPAYELSYLKQEEQTMLMSAMEYAQATPSLSQAQNLKKYSQLGRLDENLMCAIMEQEKKPEWGKITFKPESIKKYFPADSTPKQMQDTIIKLLEQWQRSRANEHSR